MADDVPTSESVDAAGAPGVPAFTSEGRRWLEARAEHLRQVVVPELLALMEDGDHSVADEQQRVMRELDGLDDLLARAGAVEDAPDDPALVELGELVTIALEDGSFERYLLVDPYESAVLGGTRVPSDSPLGRALLGSRVGDEVEVNAPGGTYRCRVAGAERLSPPPG
jgi:transcription elongation factor GreA